MSILVTGAAGFIGVRLVQQLDALGYHVIVFDRNTRPTYVELSENVTWIVKDIALEGIQSGDINGVDTVIHLAGSTLGAGEDEYNFLMANEATTIRLLQACAKQVDKLIFASSQVVYGDINHTAVSEDFELKSTGSAYACSKVNSESWLQWFHKKHGGTYLAFRFSGFIEGGGIIDYIIDRALRNEPIELYSKGVIHRDYLSISQGVDVLLAALNFTGSKKYTPINIGSGYIISASELAELICNEADSLSEIVLSNKSAPQGDFVFDISRAKELFDFTPEYLPKAVKKYVQYKKVSYLKGNPSA